MSALPAELEALVREVVGSCDLDEAGRSEVRADLEQHLLDGLARGRSVEELIERFGDPRVAADLISRSDSPAAPTPTSAQGDGLVVSLAMDLRHAVRGVMKSPSLAITATIVLALGVGANTVVFTVLNELLLRPIAVEDPTTLVDIWADIPGGNSFLGFAYQDYLTYRAENDVLEEVVAFTGRRLELGSDDASEEVVGQFVTPGYFAMLGLTPSAGVATFSEGVPFGAPPVAVLAHPFWTESFGADPAIVGRTVRLQGHEVTVMGIGPVGYSGHFIGFPSDMWLPLTSADPLLSNFDPEDRGQKELEMLGRLRTGVSASVARSALNVLAEGIERQYPDLNRGHRVGLTPTTGLDHSLQAGVTAFVLVLTTVSILVLMIACLNVGSVLLVRAMSRDRELALRIALGAGRPRLVRQLVTEATVLVTLGTAVGVAVALQLNSALAGVLEVVASGLGLDLRLDWRVLGLTAMCALLAAVLASIAPALHLFRQDPANALRARGGPSRHSARLRSILVVGQVAVSVVLVVATGLFVRALVAGGRLDPGFAVDEVATFALSLPEELDPRARAALERDVLAAIRSAPGVAAVTIAGAPPIGVARSPMSIDVPGVLPPPDSDRLAIDVRSAGAGYLETVGIALLAGRDLNEADDQGEPKVAIVSEAFVGRFWPQGDALGRTFTVGRDEVHVVGVAADARFIVQDDSPDPLVYLSRGGEVGDRPVVTVRADMPLALTSAIDEVVRAAIPGHRRVQLGTGRQVLDSALLPQRLGSIIIGAMGIAALFLAAVGLYGLVQFTVARDTHELGVRLALGGSRRDLLMVVLRKGFTLVAVGTGVGVGIALFLAPGLEGFLAGVSPADPVTYLAVIGCFAGVALIASWVPARRALKIEATEALRGD